MSLLWFFVVVGGVGVVVGPVVVVVVVRVVLSCAVSTAVVDSCRSGVSALRGCCFTHVSAVPPGSLRSRAPRLYTVGVFAGCEVFGCGRGHALRVLLSCCGLLPHRTLQLRPLA